MHIFTVWGEPTAAARPRLSKGRTYNPKAEQQKAFQRKCREELAVLGWTEPSGNLFRVHLELYLPVPQSMQKRFKTPVYHKGRGDCDNYAKFVCDAMNGVLYTDDAQIVDMNIIKLCDLKPRTVIRFEELV